MSKSRVKTLMAGTVSLLGLATITSPVQAQTETLDEVIVTAKRQFRPDSSNAASKLDLPVTETPQALTVLGEEFLDIANLNSTAEVVAYTAGIQNGGIGDGTEAVLVARGFEIDRERSYRINGLSVYSEIDLDYFAMDRVEFVRGPASSLYGEADYGATINRVLKTPQADFGTQFGASVGTDSYLRFEGDVTGPFNDSGSIAGRFVGVYESADEFMDETDSNHYAFAPSVSFTGENTSLLLQAYYSHFGGKSSDGFPLVLDADETWYIPDVPKSRNYALSTNGIDSTNAFYFGRLTHNFTDSLKLTFAGAFADVDMFNESSYLCDCDEVYGDGVADLYYFLEDKDQKNSSFDLALEKTFTLGGREQRVLVSADWRKNKLFQPFSPDYIGAEQVDFVNEGGPFETERPEPDPNIYFDGSQEFSGLSLLGYFKLTERFSVLAGLRQSRTESDFTEVFYEEIFDEETEESEFVLVENSDGGKDDAWVPRLGLVYKVGENHNLFASYSEGIIFNEDALDFDRNPIKPETGVQYEFGIKGEVLNDRLFYSASAFTIKRTDLAALDPDTMPGDPAVFYNIGEQVHEGIDLELQGEPIPGWNVYLSYAFLDVEINDSADPAEIGQVPGDSPRHSLSVFSTYEMLSGPLKSLTFGGGVVYRGERNIDSFGSFVLPAYTRFDFRASYDFNDNLSIELNGQNIFDEDIYTAAYAAPDFGNGFSDTRRWSLGVSWRH